MAEDGWHVVYRVTGKDADTRADLVYYGEVRVLGSQTLKQACDYRLDLHFEEKKAYLAGLAPKTAGIKELSTRLRERDALLLEATHTVVHWNVDQSVRGGPWCQKTLLPQDVAELRSLKHIACETSQGLV